MSAGSALLMSMVYGLRAVGQWSAPRAGNILDGSAYFYTCYACADGGWVAVGAIERDFRRQLLQLLGLTEELEEILKAPDNDPAVRCRLATIFRSRTRREWEQLFAGTDACVTPVLSLDEVMSHPQNEAEAVFSSVNDTIQPNPAPKFSRTSNPPATHQMNPAQRTAALAAWGLSLGDVQ
jgi:alpha-methylacyl-CoA racemase